jgi:uncharacterized protein (TIGR03067 family)
MKFALNALVCCAVFAGAAAASDFETVQGTWKLVAGIRDGKPMTGADLDMKLTIQGNHYSVTAGPQSTPVSAGTFQINDKTNPRQVDLAVEEGDDKGKPVLGIYEIRAGNRHRVCFAPAGAARPSKFGSRPGSGELFEEWERVK